MFNATVYFQSASSNKQYRVIVRRAQNGFFNVVTFFGRIGSTQIELIRTAKPVALSAAKATAQELIDKKLAKGYSLKLRNTVAKTASVRAPETRVAFRSPKAVDAPKQTLPASKYFRPNRHDIVAASYLETETLEGGTHMGKVVESGKGEMLVAFTFYRPTATGTMSLIKLRWNADKKEWFDVTDRVKTSLAPATAKQIALHRSYVKAQFPVPSVYKGHELVLRGGRKIA